MDAPDLVGRHGTALGTYREHRMDHEASLRGPDVDGCRWRSSGRVEVWEYGSGRRISSSKSTPDRSSASRSVRTGLRVASSSNDAGEGVVKVWEILSGGEALSFRDPAGLIERVTLQPRWSSAWQPRDGTGRSHPLGRANRAEMSLCLRGTATVSGGSISAPAATASSPLARR